MDDSNNKSFMTIDNKTKNMVGVELDDSPVSKQTEKVKDRGNVIEEEKIELLREISNESRLFSGERFDKNT
jgi:hypothetical protein